MKRNRENFLGNILSPKSFETTREKLVTILNSFDKFCSNNRDLEDTDRNTLELLDFNFINHGNSLINKIQTLLDKLFHDKLDILIKINANNGNLLKKKKKEKKNIKKREADLDEDNDQEIVDKDDPDIIKSGKYLFKKYLVKIYGACNNNKSKFIIFSIQHKKNVIINSILFNLIYIAEMKYSKLNHIRYLYDDINNIHYVFIVIS